MPPIKYAPGTIWGFKQIIGRAGSNKYSQPTYWWRCLSCGKVYGPSVGTDLARNPRAKCCPIRFEAKSNYKGFKEITGSKLAQCKDSARKRGLEFAVTAEYLWEIWLLQEGKCAYTGKSLTHGKDASLDRIDSSKGYIEGNVHWVDWQINRMKLNVPHEQFIQLCRDVVLHSIREKRKRS